jgi:hypothetical protein
MRLAQSLDTPDRKAFAKEQMALRMAETRNKRRRLENMFDENNEHNNASSESVSAARSGEQTNASS